jgi:hypothetical protein
MNHPKEPREHFGDEADGPDDGGPHQEHGKEKQDRVPGNGVGLVPAENYNVGLEVGRDHRGSFSFDRKAPIGSGLAVVPGDVANAGDGWPVGEGAVGASLVVVVDPVWQRCPSRVA